MYLVSPGCYEFVCKLCPFCGQATIAHAAIVPLHMTKLLFLANVLHQEAWKGLRLLFAWRGVAPPLVAELAFLGLNVPT